MEDTTQCTSMGEYKEVSKQILPIDGQILGRIPPTTRYVRNGGLCPMW